MCILHISIIFTYIYVYIYVYSVFPFTYICNVCIHVHRDLVVQISPRLSLSLSIYGYIYTYICTHIHMYMFNPAKFKLHKCAAPGCTSLCILFLVIVNIFTYGQTLCLYTWMYTYNMHTYYKHAHIYV